MTCPAQCFDRRNLLTYVSLLSSLGAIAAAQLASAGGAGALVAAAVIADTFDGRFARRFGDDPIRRAFGAQIDSLSDAIAFGVVPVVCASILSPPVDLVGLAAMVGVGFTYAACAITRLGFYNLTSDARGFTGLPVPVAALVWATALLWHPNAAWSAGLLVICAGAMVAPLRIPRPAGAGLAAFVAWPILVAVAHASSRGFWVLGAGFWVLGSFHRPT